MDKSQAKQHASNELIVKEATNDLKSLELVPSFKKSIIRLDEINAEVNSLEIEQEKDLSGIATNKKTVRLSLIDWLLEVGGAVYSCASETGNNILKSRVDYKQSMIKRMEQLELISVAGIIMEEARLLSAEILLEQGISRDDLATFQSLIDKFKDIQSSPQEAIIDRSAATEKIGTLLAEARGIIKNSLDKLALQYKRKNPEFYRRYKAARGRRYKGKSSKPEPVSEPEVPAIKG
jgi:hypothetical protein